MGVFTIETCPWEGSPPLRLDSNHLPRTAQSANEASGDKANGHSILGSRPSFNLVVRAPIAPYVVTDPHYHLRAAFSGDATQYDPFRIDH
jgi:hypothetical protein